MHVAMIGLPSRPVQGHNPKTHRLGVDHRRLTAGEHDELTEGGGSQAGKKVSRRVRKVQCSQRRAEMARMADECKRWIDGKNGGSEMTETADARVADMCGRCVGDVDETADKRRRWIKGKMADMCGIG